MLSCVAYSHESIATNEQFAAHLESIRVKDNLPALAAMQIKDGGVTAAVTGYREAGNPTKATITDRFHLGSCTKAMTATLVGIYIDNGKLTFDSTLEELFPDYEIHDELKKVTVAMLLSHMSGIVGGTKPEEWSELGLGFDKIKHSIQGVVKQRAFITKTILSIKPEYTPGTQFNYSNFGYVILGHILENFGHNSWEDIIVADLFRPLKMYNCSFGPPKNQNKQHPTQPWPHEYSSKGPISVFPGNSELADNPLFMGPTGTVNCSLEDWSRFALLHLHVSKQKLLMKSTMQKLHTIYPGQEYTYGGWGKDYKAWASSYALQHAGSNGMNLAIITIVPEVNTILLFATNVRIPDAQIPTVVKEVFKLDKQ